MMFNYPWPKNSLKKENIKFELTKNQSIKIEELEYLKNKIRTKAAISFKEKGNFVFNDGDINAKLMFIGEAPGEEEDIQGIPFVGRSGKLLRFFLKEAKINEYYITNIVPWRPPNNRTPTNEEINIMKPFILEHISIINPKIIITIGTTALKALNINETITNAQNKLIKTEIGNIFPIYHPSYALRVNMKKKELWYSLLNLHNIINNKSCNN